MEMTPHNFIGRHPREHLQVICTKSVLSTCHGNPSIIPNARGLGVNLSFCLSPSLGFLCQGVSSSTEGVGDAIPTIPGVGAEGSATRMGAPLSVIRTDLAPMADKGSSFLFLIQAYMFLLNFVVISARGEHLLIFIQVSTKGSILTNLTLTLFSFNFYDTQHVGGWVWT